MISKEAERSTDKAHPDQSEVIVNEADVNVTLAHHAAWTDERFETAEERLGGLEAGQQSILEAIGGLSARVGNLETAHVAMHAQMGRVEIGLSGKVDGIALRIDKVLEILKEKDRYSR